ncbi:MAG: tetratricopeptide repeat protein [Planctomycetota bacterium]
MRKVLTKSRFKNGRRLLYPVGALLVAALVYAGFFHVAEPDPEVLLASAEVYAHSGLYEEAKEIAFQVLKEKPDSVDARLILGLVAERTGDLDAALGIYEKLKREVDGATKRRRLELSCIDLERRLQRFESAKARVAASREAGDKNPQLERILGVIAFDEGHTTVAIRHFESYLTMVPESEEAKSLLIQAQLSNGQTSKARDLLSRVDEKSQTCWPLWPRLARTCLEAGDEEGALAALSRYAELDAHAQNRLRQNEYWRSRVESGEFSEIFN